MWSEISDLRLLIEFNRDFSDALQDFTTAADPLWGNNQAEPATYKILKFQVRLQDFKIFNKIDFQ